MALDVIFLITFYIVLLIGEIHTDMMIFVSGRRMMFFKIQFANYGDDANKFMNYLLNVYDLDSEFHFLPYHLILNRFNSYNIWEKNIMINFVSA